METPERIDLRLIHNELLRGMQQIFRNQREIARVNIYGKSGPYAGRRTGRLREFLDNPEYDVQTGNLGVHGHIDYPLYIRFLDMKKNGNNKIYNRQVWGILYKETFRHIRYTLSGILREWAEGNLAPAIEELAKPIY